MGGRSASRACKWPADMFQEALRVILAKIQELQPPTWPMKLRSRAGLIFSRSILNSGTPDLPYWQLWMPFGNISRRSTMALIFEPDRVVYDPDKRGAASNPPVTALVDPPRQMAGAASALFILTNEHWSPASRGRD